MDFRLPTNLDDSSVYLNIGMEEGENLCDDGGGCGRGKMGVVKNVKLTTLPSPHMMKIIGYRLKKDHVSKNARALVPLSSTGLSCGS